MQALFLTLYPDSAASPRYRVAQFLPYLRATGIECTAACPLTHAEYARLAGPDRRMRPFWYHFTETPRRISQILSARRYDVVFLQKAIMTAYVRGMAGLLEWRARSIIYDIDDAVHLAPPHPLRGVWRAFEERDQVLRTMRLARLVLAGNRWLQAEAEAAGARATLFPTVVDTERFVPAGAKGNAVYRVGWIGNPSTTAHLEPAASALRELREGEVVLVGADSSRVPFPHADVRPWSLDTEVEEVQRFSVGIMPLPDSDWVRGKCGLKALQYMACGIPCVASPRGVALDLIADGVNGLLAETPDQWHDALERLRDPALRQTLGEAGRAMVEAKYSLGSAAPRLRELLESAV